MLTFIYSLFWPLIDMCVIQLSELRVEVKYIEGPVKSYGTYFFDGSKTCSRFILNPSLEIYLFSFHGGGVFLPLMCFMSLP